MKVQIHTVAYISQTKIIKSKFSKSKLKTKIAQIKFINNLILR